MEAMKNKLDKDTPVTCDFCGKEFTVGETQLDQAEVMGAEVKFWACPHCNHRYVVRIYTKEQIELDEAYQEYAADLVRRRKRGLSVNPARIKKLEKLRQKAENFQKSLKEKHLGGVTALLNGEIDTKRIKM